ncbi:insulin-like peptide INSL6 [Marmota flaviventris]|uniref:insulin-like peptide INSL6 n=1 Tax=Marmota flaviventris TaxID=93162 RepID=UPI003A8A05D9
MTQLFGLLLLWFGPLLLQFSSQLREDLTRTRKLCGRYLVKEIEKLCGTTNWSQFKLEEETPNTEEPPIPGEIEIFDPYEYQNHRNPFPERGKVTNPASASPGKPVNSLGIQSHSKYHYKKVNWLPIKISDYSSSDDVDPYSHDSFPSHFDSVVDCYPETTSRGGPRIRQLPNTSQNTLLKAIHSEPRKELGTSPTNPISCPSVHPPGPFADHTTQNQNLQAT